MTYHSCRVAQVPCVFSKREGRSFVKAASEYNGKYALSPRIFRASYRAFAIPDTADTALLSYLASLAHATDS